MITATDRSSWSTLVCIRPSPSAPRSSGWPRPSTRASHSGNYSELVDRRRHPHGRRPLGSGCHDQGPCRDGPRCGHGRQGHCASMCISRPATRRAPSA
jgi:hypothetical protein